MFLEYVVALSICQVAAAKVAAEEAYHVVKRGSL